MSWRWITQDKQSFVYWTKTFSGETQFNAKLIGTWANSAIEMKLMKTFFFYQMHQMLNTKHVRPFVWELHLVNFSIDCWEEKTLELRFAFILHRFIWINNFFARYEEPKKMRFKRNLYTQIRRRRWSRFFFEVYNMHKIILADWKFACKK